MASTSLPITSSISPTSLNDLHNNVNNVKIYLYDVPKKFTYGVVKQFSLGRGHGVGRNAAYPGHQHMTERYLFSDLTRPQSDLVGSPVVRVSDPEEAYLFYLPFFSSLSLIVNQEGGGVGGNYSDEEMQAALVDWLEVQEYWKRSSGRDNMMVATDPNAYYKVIDRIKKSVLPVSDFGRVRIDQGLLTLIELAPSMAMLASQIELLCCSSWALTIKKRQS